MKKTGLGVLMGAAAVAGLVLAGCQEAAGPAVDYAPALAGTWTRSAQSEDVEIQVAVAGQTTKIEVPVLRSISVTVTRTGMNSGTVSLTVTDTPDSESSDYPPVLQRPELAQFVPDSMKATATGTLESKKAELRVTVSNITVPEVPEGVSLTATDKLSALKGTTHRIAYEVKGNTIELSGQALALLQVTTNARAKLVLTKQASG